MTSQQFKAGDPIRYRTWGLPGCTFIEATVESAYPVGQWQMLRLTSGVVIAAQDCEPA